MIFTRIQNISVTYSAWIFKYSVKTLFWQSDILEPFQQLFLIDTAFVAVNFWATRDEIDEFLHKKMHYHLRPDRLSTKYILLYPVQYSIVAHCSQCPPLSPGFQLFTELSTTVMVICHSTSGDTRKKCIKFM